MRPPPKTRRKEGSPLNKVWLRVASPSMRPFMGATSSHMGGRSAYPVTPHVKQRWSSESVATLTKGAMSEGEGGDDPTFTATAP